MNNKKGFTLVELLAVLILLSVLALMIFPVVEDYVTSSRKQGNQVEIDNIIAATKNWEADNLDKIPDSGETYTLTLGDLIDGGYIDEVENHVTKTKMSTSTEITITNHNENYEYKVTIVDWYLYSFFSYDTIQKRVGDKVAKEKKYQAKNIYACANIEGMVEEIFYMVMDSKNKVNYLIMDDQLIEIPMSKEDSTYMPIHMKIIDLIDIYNQFYKSMKGQNKEYERLKLKKELTEKELISIIYLLDNLLRDSFLQVARKMKQSSDEDEYNPVEKRLVHRRKYDIME